MQGKDKTRLIVNPYAGVDWSAIHRCKANFHAHTTRSDGRMTPAEVIDAYCDAGYAILAITEHDHYSEDMTWPWTRWNRDPEEMGMIAIPGNELFQIHDVGSYWNDYMGSPSGGDEDEVIEGLQEVAARGGLGMFFHPGRNGRRSAWYASLYRRFDVLVGVEVFNQGDRHPDDRRHWDRLLSQLMPDRPVWGYSNDDSHGREHLFGNYQEMLMNTLTRTELIHCMQRGRFTFSWEAGCSGLARAPRIDSIDVDENQATITLHSSGFDFVEWITGQGRIVGRDLAFCYADFDGPFVRVRLLGRSGETLTQPFGFST
ncbi:MAG TPA: hypothetical protein VLH40_05460 [Atribacteraceae bacterium]|nr:hypothetical protein [Atribacteraceae bacterium]